MLAELKPRSTALAIADLEALRDRGLDLEAQGRAPSTRREYARALAAFEEWTATNGLASDPGDVASVYGYLSYLSTRRALATVLKIAAALSSLAQDAGSSAPLRNPRIARLIEGLKRETALKGTRQAERAPLPVENLRRTLAEIDRDSLLGKRDACILLLGFTGALRRSELVALNLDDVNFVEEGATLTIRRSKTDQIGAGAEIAVPRGTSPATCPVRALEAWLDAAGRKDGPLLRSIDRHGNLGGRLGAQYVAHTVKRAARRAGLDVARLSAHSLRAGAATTASKRGESADQIKRLGRWKSDTYQRYIRHESCHANAPARNLGL
jgi:integrase